MMNFQDIAFECRLYSDDTTAYNHQSIVDQDCAGNPSEAVTSNRKWYWRNEVEGFPLVDCMTYRNADDKSRFSNFPTSY